MGNWAHKDFMSLWTGGRAVAMGMDPYDAEVWPNLRVRHGSQWMPDPRCPFPLWTLILFAPLSLLPLPLAAAVWMTVSEIAVLCTVALALRRRDSSIRGTVLAATLVGTFLYRPFVSALLHGQVVPLLVLLIAVALFLYERGHTFFAGLTFALLLMKPNLFILFFPALGLLLLTRRDWQALAGLASGTGGLLAMSWILLPGWIFEWMDVTSKAIVAFGTPSVWGLVAQVASPQSRMLWGTGAVCVVSGVTLFLLVRRSDAWLVGIGLALCGSLFITPYLWAYDQLLLLIPALVAFQSLEEHRLFQGIGWLSSVVVVPWGLFWMARSRGGDSLTGLVPLVVVGYLCTSWWLSETDAT